MIVGVLFVTILLSACAKEEGVGGRSTIIGKIFVQDYDSDGLLKDEYYPGDWPVYIIYGNDEVYGDEEKTNFDGKFVFDYLYEGTYTIYSYSKCKSCPGEVEAILQVVEIGKNETIRLDDIIVKD